jgi:tripartite ATP-independent transporter DctP family solute receptor
VRNKRTLILALTALLLLTACFGNVDEVITIRYGTTSAAYQFEDDGSGPIGVAVRFFMQEIERRTDGRIIVRLFPDGQLASNTEDHISGLVNGSFDMFSLNSGAWSDVTPAFAGLNVPYLYFSFEEVWAVLDSEIGQRWMQRAYQDTGVLPLAYIDIGFRQITNRDFPIITPDDVVGLSLRTMPDTVQIATWEALGAIVTPIPFAGLYTALAHGLVDAQENPSLNVVFTRVYEHQSYMTITNHSYTATIIAVSKMFWEKLTEEDRELITEVLAEALELSRRETLAVEDEFRRYLTDVGLQITELTEEQFLEFQAAVQSTWPMIAELVGQDEFDELVNFVNAMRD